MNEKEQVKTDNTITYNGLFVFFIIVTVIFGLMNFGEEILLTGDGLGKIGVLEDQAVTVWGGVQRLLGKSQAYGATTYGDVGKLRNGYSFMPEIDENVSPMLQAIDSANELAESIGARFIYVQCPVKQLDRSYYPKGIMDYSLDKYNAMITGLEARDIDYIDMKSVLESTDTDWYDYFYYSDHHWRNSAAFIAYNQICRRMQNDGALIDEEMLDVNAFLIEQYDNIFLGSHGRMAGPIYAGLDGYELYIPKNEMKLSINVPSKGISKNGNFEECLIHREYLEKYSFDYYAYYIYLDEDYELIEIKNEEKIDGPSVVIVRDSLAVPVSAFLTTQCSEIDILDLRYSEDIDTVQYIRDKAPDYILYIFGTGYLGDDKACQLR